MTMSGTLTTSTKAPTRIASPPRSSMNVDTHAVASGRGAPIWASSFAKPDGPRLSLAHPWAMNPKPMISRSGSGTHWPQKALFRSLNISNSLSGSLRSRVLRFLRAVDAAGAQEESECDDGEDGPGDRGEEIVPLEEEYGRRQRDSQHRQGDQQHNPDRHTSIREAGVKLRTCAAEQAPDAV